ncbi:acetyl-CoA synthetase-like protein [Abortiporus biennis]|nr:acetyl-CoA synthetase-like protein [Abortiporus biennis]
MSSTSIPPSTLQQANNPVVSFNSPRVVLEKTHATSTPLTIPGLFDWNGENNSEYPYFVYVDDEGENEALKTVSFKDVQRGIHRAARHVYDKTQQGASPENDGAAGLLGVLSKLAEAISYSTFMLGVMRSGNTVFPISPRNSPEAVAHLLMKTNASSLFVGKDAGIREIAEMALEKVKAHEGPNVTLHSIPTLEDLFPTSKDGAKDDFKPFPEVNYQMDAPVMIMHSSGSTAFPKPIPWPHRDFAQWALIPLYSTGDIAGLVMSCHSTPVFHAIGIAQLIYAASGGLTLSTFKPSIPPVFPTPDRIFESMIKTRCQMGMFVPMFVEQWAQDSKKVEYMKTMKGLLFGGGPLAKEVGDKLAKDGVCIGSIYGSTEIGCISTFIRETPVMDWEYLEISKHLDFVFESRDDGKFELVVFAGGPSQPQVLNTKINGRDAFATNDLFTPHPTKSHLWKIYGRADDQIMLSTGEKTNPGPLERILEQDPHIRHAIIFGRGKQYNGVLIDPLPDFVFDPNGDDGESRLEEFRNKIWPTVERMNEFAPQHSRLFKEMIMVSLPNKPFSHTAKGTVRRPAVINEYQPEIEALYKKVEKISNLGMDDQNGTDAEVVHDWNFENTIEFVRKVVFNVLKRSVQDEDDLFQHGCDSLQATWIRMQISGMLARTKPDVADRLPSQFVFQAPSILALTNLILKSVNSIESSELEGGLEKRVQELVAAVERFTADIPTQSIQTPEIRRKIDGDAVLVTGTTGGLGSNMLVHLSNDPKVSKIYAVNRKSRGSNLKERQMETIKNNGLEDEYVDSSKTVLVEADLSKPQFGLTKELYEELRTSVTHIIHNAWIVDFNLNLPSFESAIQGVRNLVDFALSSPYKPHIVFTGSIGVFRNPATPGHAKEEYILDPKVPAGSGYGESKWVSERILAIASERTGLKTTTVRIGQLSGDKNGHWNEKEWFPSIVKSGVFTQCLPDVPGGLVTWIPLYEAGKVLIEMRHSDEPILHLVNGHPVPWHTIMETLAGQMGVPLVPYEKWLKKLKYTLSDTSLTEVEHMDRNPALKLLDLYENATFDADEPLGIVRLDITKAKKAVPALEDVRLDLAYIQKLVPAWRASGFLPKLN